MEPALMRAYAKMLPVLQAREKLIAHEVLVAAGGKMRREEYTQWLRETRLMGYGREKGVRPQSLDELPMQVVQE